MKFKFFIVALALTALSAVSCVKDDGAFVGTYTYKTSGTVSLMPVNMAGGGMMTTAIYPEQGQLNVVKDGDGYILTFNNLLGGGEVARATEADGVLTITSTSPKAIQIVDASSSKIGGGVVSFTAEGKKYDDMLLIDFKMSGAVQIAASGAQMMVSGSSVNCIAKKN